MIDDLAKFVKIYSVKSAPLPRAPFGASLRAALDLFLERAASYGLRCGEDDGYYAWAEYGGGDLIGILAHIDVVPVGDGWHTDPLVLTRIDNNLFGRGAIDDKGGLVAALHALKKLSDEKTNIGCRVRLIVGCDEESGSSCIKRYARQSELPVVSFTPDAEFPVINSEKGIAHLRVTLPAEKLLADNFVELWSGERPNVVPSLASCKIVGGTAERLRQSGMLQKHAGDFVIEDIADAIVIVAHGTAAHGSTPEKGENAARKLLCLLAQIVDSPAIRFAAEKIASGRAAELFGINVRDEKSGELTFNLGMLSLCGGSLSVTLDVRKPVSLTFDTLLAAINDKLPSGSVLTALSLSDNLYVSEDDPLVQSLLAVYEKHVGHAAKPLQIGGGTYAKELPRCVGFGPSIDGVDYHMHDCNEFIPAEWLYKLKDIYYDAIIALSKLVKN